MALLELSGCFLVNSEDVCSALTEEMIYLAMRKTTVPVEEMFAKLTRRRPLS